MQQVLNAPERSSAFFKFLLYFIITVCLVLAAVYFDFRVPSEQNKKLLQANAEQNAINDREEKFVAKMESISRLLDTLDKPGVSVDFFSSRIGEGINDLFKDQESENPFYDKLNRTVVNKFLELLKEKKASLKKEKELTDVMRAKADLQEQYNNLKAAANSNPVPQGQ